MTESPDVDIKRHPRRVFAAGARALVVFAVAASTSWLAAGQQRAPIGRGVAVPTHLQDGQGFTVPLPVLLAHGLLLFNANWTEQEGGGRPLTKGTGRPISDPSHPLVGARAF